MLDNCADLLQFKKYEAFVRALFAGPKGEWIGVQEMLGSLGLSLPAIEASVRAVWLSSPTDGDDYAFILFYCDSTGDSLTASYNRALLLRSD